MRNSQFIRGVGVGLLVATLIFAVTGKQDSRPLSEQEIIRKARQLGMYTEEEVENIKLDESLSKVDGNVKNEQNQTSYEESDSAAGVASPGAVSEEDGVTSPGAITDKDETDDPDKTAGESQDTADDSEDAPDTNVVQLTISQGMPSNEVAKLLENAGVIKSASAFDQYLCNHGYESYIKSGTYSFSGEADFETIAEAITWI